MRGAEAVFIAVGTPSRRGDGHADLTYLFAAAEEIARGLSAATRGGHQVDRAGRHRAQAAGSCSPGCGPTSTIDVASNPEFLREGSAIEDFMRPDRVVVGVESEHARQVLERLYRPLNLIQTPILFTTLETAELIKYATNSFLATKITFINEMADLCERVGADVQAVAKGIGSRPADRQQVPASRAGLRRLVLSQGHPGAASASPSRPTSPLRIVESVVAVNEGRKRRMVRRIVQACGGSVRGQTIAILGVTFKPNTDDMRDSPSLVIVPALQAEGATVRAYDPEGMARPARALPEVVWCEDAYAAMDGADAMVILTEWNAVPRRSTWSACASCCGGRS